jgi:acetylornithine/succinyldiaminopimelate/putrescine aminotransferase
VYARLDLTPVRGAGCYLIDADGHRYLDFYGGHAVALVGHCHPLVVAAIREQAGRLLFYSSAVHSEIRERAGQLLLGHAPFAGSQLFHCCSGSEANEVAFKIARRATGRPRIISFGGSFHGRTIGALSACGLEAYRKTAGPVIVEEHAILPYGDRDTLAHALDGRTAAVIVEGIQSLGGVHEADHAFLRFVAELAAERGAVVIFDEVQTGLGRTGSYFYADQVGVRPDLITLAKGLASGIPAAAVIVAPHLAATVRPGDHGSTFGGGPVAMAALAATLEVIEREGLVANAARMGAVIAEEARGLDGVLAVRGRGLLLGLELDRPAKGVQRLLLERGVVVGTAAPSNVVRLLPPLSVGPSEVERLVTALRAALQA